MPIRADSLDIMMCRISQTVGRIIPDASEVLCPSQRALRSMAFSDLHGHGGMLQREGCSDAMAQVARKCQIPHTVLLFSHRPWMDGKQANWPFPKPEQANLANADIHPSSCSPGLPRCKKLSLCRITDLYNV